MAQKKSDTDRDEEALRQYPNAYSSISGGNRKRLSEHH
jgi:hypothetical protein